MLVCPGCQESKAVRRARRKGSLDAFWHFFNFYPYRCESCMTRFRRFGNYKLAFSQRERLPAGVADPAAFTPLKFESKAKRRQSRTIEEPDVVQTAQPAAAILPNGGKVKPPKPFFLTGTREKQPAEDVPVVNPFAMKPVRVDPGDVPVRLADLERFDPLILRNQVKPDEAPLRAEGEHLFDPLAMESAALARAKQVRQQQSAWARFFSAVAARRAERSAFLDSDEGRSVRSAIRRQRRWFAGSLAVLIGIDTVIAYGLHGALGARGFAPKLLWLSIALGNLIAGIALAAVYPRFVREYPGRMRPIFLDLGVAWVAGTISAQILFGVILVPVLGGGRLNLGFFRHGWPWIWFSYGALAMAAGIGWLIRRAGSHDGAPDEVEGDAESPASKPLLRP